jgi:hypothetical protein
MPADRHHRPVLYALTLSVLFVAGLGAYLQYSGTSPIVWADTLNDEREVQRCLVHSSCTLVGMRTSLPGIVHAVGWLELRTLVAWLGVGLDGAHLFIQVLNALMVVLTFHVARRLGGSLAGSLAVLLLGVSYLRLPALYNTSPLPFLDTVLMVACTAAVERPRIVTVGLAALVAAVMANVHAACIITGASVVWVALLAPQRRWRLAAFGAALFAVATFLIAPPSWLHNLAHLLQPRDPSAPPARPMAVPSNELYWTKVAIVAWVASFAGRAPVWAVYRRQSQGALAVIVPFLAAFFLAAHFGIDANGKYLAHLNSACAVAAAFPLGLVARQYRAALVQRFVTPAEQISPFAAALIIAISPRFTLLANDEPTPTMRDLASVAQILHDEHGWDVPTISQRLKTPRSALVFTELCDLNPARRQPGPVVTDDGTTAMLLRVATNELPRPLPPHWRVIRHSSRVATLLVFTSSRLDWSRFQICTRRDDTPASCEDSSLRFDPAAPVFTVANMPAPMSLGPVTLTLRLPLRPGTPGSTNAIFMPRGREICGGYVASASGAGLDVSPDRRHATFAAPAPGQASFSTLELTWDILSPECDGMTYDGLPPLIVEGDAATVHALEGILTKTEGKL